MGGAGTFESLSFYRGVSRKYTIDRPYLVVPRRDRRPKNSSTRFHEVADAWFETNFGVRYRSQGVFVTSRPLTASTYAATPAHVVRVIPTSKYRYCWSPNVSDLLFAASSLEAASSVEIGKWLEGARYQEIGLNEAHSMGHEVMLFCDQYIAIPQCFIDSKSEQEASTILVLK